jgi:nucleotide-binding universal stress UspA family protein
MFQNALVCTDLIDGLQRFVEFIPQLASLGLRRIVFFHHVAISEAGQVPKIDTEKLERTRIRLAPALQRVPPGVEVKIEVQSESFRESILKLIERYEIEVILASSPPQTSLETTIFGSKTLDISKATLIPLLIFRPQLISSLTQEELNLRSQHLWQELLIPYNDGPSARYLVQQLKQAIAAHPNDSLKRAGLLWVVEPNPRQADVTTYRVQEAQKRLEEVRAELANFIPEVWAEVRLGEPLLEILEVLLYGNTSAIAIANAARNIFLEWTVPSFAQEILSHSWFPVLYFSPTK